MAKRKSAGRWRECMRTAKIGPDIDQVSEKEKHFGWIHLRSLSTWNFLHLSKQTVTLGNLIWLETCCFLYVLVSFVIVVVARSSSLSSVTTQNNSWYATISLKTDDLMERRDENDVRRYPERGSLNQRQINARDGKVLAGKWTRTRLRRFRKLAPFNQ